MVHFYWFNNSQIQSQSFFFFKFSLVSHKYILYWNIALLWYEIIDKRVSWAIYDILCDLIINF